MPKPPTPPEEIAPLMQFIAEKAKHVKSPMNVAELCRQFKEETGTLMSVESLKERVRTYRHKIHEMNQFDKPTKVKMIFALSASIDAGLLVELKKVADVDVDDKQRIIRYKQKDGGFELSAKYMLSVEQGEERDREIIQFLVDKSKTTDTPIAGKALLREFKEKTGYTDSISALEHRYQRVKSIIYQSSGIDENTKIKMMFISNAELSDETLKELRNDAFVEVDGEGRITKYEANDGSLNLEGNHRISTVSKLFHSDRWKDICQKTDNYDSEEDEKDNSNWQKRYEKKQIDLVRFLIKRTKNATFPLNITNLAKDFETEFKSSDSVLTTEKRIRSFRQRIHSINQFDIPTKVKLAFALSASIDADFLKELQKDAIVELDEKLRIKQYQAADGSLELKRNYSRYVRVKAASAKRIRIVNNSNESTGEKNAQSTRLSQSTTAIQKGRKRARVAYSSSESSEKDDEELVKQEDNCEMDFDTNNTDYFDYDPPSYELDMEHIPIEKKPESLMEVKTEESPTTIVGNHYEENLFDYDLLTNVDDMEDIPEEKKPETLIEVKTEEPDGPSTSNVEYHYEENFGHILIESKPELFK